MPTFTERLGQIQSSSTWKEKSAALRNLIIKFEKSEHLTEHKKVSQIKQEADVRSYSQEVIMKCKVHKEREPESIIKMDDI